MFAYTKGNNQEWRKLATSKQVLWQTVKTVCNVCLYKGQSSRIEKTRLNRYFGKQWRQCAMFAYTKGNLQEKRKQDTSKQILWQTVETVCNVYLNKGQSSRKE